MISYSFSQTSASISNGMMFFLEILNMYSCQRDFDHVFSDLYQVKKTDSKSVCM